MEPLATARVEKSARTEDETYSSAKQEDDSDSREWQPESEAQGSEFHAEALPESEMRPQGSSTGEAFKAEFPWSSSAKVSFFA
jgi:hypothetical protein